MTIKKLGSIIRRLAAQAWLNSKVFWLVELVAFAVFVWIYSRDYRNEPSITVSGWFSDHETLSSIFGTSFGMAALFGVALEVGLTMVLLVPMIRDWLIERERQKIEELTQTIQKQDQAIEERDQAIGERDQAIGERDQAIGERDQAIGEQTRTIEELRQENERLRQERGDNGNSPDSD
jgi:hypothetical protein